MTDLPFHPTSVGCWPGNVSAAVRDASQLVKKGGAGVLRLFGTALLGFAVLLGCALRATNWEVKRVAVRALGAYYALSSLAVLWLQLAGHFNVLGWGMVATHMVLAAWFLSAFPSRPR